MGGYTSHISTAHTVFNLVRKMGKSGSKQHHHHHTTIVRQNPEVARINQETQAQKQRHELKMAEMKTKETKEALIQCEGIVFECKEHIEKNEKIKAELSKEKNIIEESLKLVIMWLDKFPDYRKDQLLKLAIMIGLGKAERELNRCEDIIDKTVDACQIDEENITTFLKLTQCLLTTTLQNQENAISLGM